MPVLPLRHWRGELPLAVSLGLGLLAAIPPAMVVHVLQLHGADIRAPWAMLATLLGFQILTLLCLAWYATGAWRAARRRGGIPGLVARACLALLTFAVTTIIAVSAWAALPEAWAAWQDDPAWPRTQVTIDTQGHIIGIDGPLRWSTTTRLRAILRENPQARLVRLSGPGGRITTGLELYDIIRAHKLETLVTADCASACTDAFLAGTRRWIGPAARLGFHQGAIAGGTAHSIDTATDRLYRSAGLSPAFIQRVLSGGTGLWIPTQDELIASHAATDRASAGTWPLD